MSAFGSKADIALTDLDVCHSHFVALAEFIELKRRPGDGRIEERRANNSNSMALAEQSQRLFGIALDHDDIWRLVAVFRQNACAHPVGDFVNLRKVQNVVEDAHDVDDVTTPVGDNSLHQLACHVSTVHALQHEPRHIGGATRRGVSTLIETGPPRI